MSRRTLNWVLLVLLVATAAASWSVDWNAAAPNAEFLPEMVRSTPYDAFDSNPNFADGKTLREPVAGTIPRGFLPLHFEATAADLARAGEELHNPYPMDDSAALTRGALQFGRMCTPCHGPGGRRRRRRGAARLSASATAAGRERNQSQRRPDISHHYLRQSQHAAACGASFPGGPMEGHLTYPLSAGEESGPYTGHDGRNSVLSTIGSRTFFAPEPLRRLLQAMALAGVLTLVAGAVLAPQRTWANLLLAALYVLGWRWRVWFS